MQSRQALLTLLLLTFAPSFVRSQTTQPATTQPEVREDPTRPTKKIGGRPGEVFEKRHEQYLKRAAEGKIDVLFLGDSITEMWRTKGKDSWTKHFEPMRAVNFGVGGDRTQHVLWRIANGELNIEPNPKLVVLLIGTNNSNRDEPEAIAAGVTKIVEAIREKLPKSKVLLLAVFPRNAGKDKPTAMPTIRKVNEIISKLDDGGKTVKFLDLSDTFVDAQGKVRLETFPDGLHPNEQGFEIWAQAMKPVIEEMMK